MLQTGGQWPHQIEFIFLARTQNRLKVYLPLIVYLSSLHHLKQHVEDKSESLDVEKENLIM